MPLLFSVAAVGGCSTTCVRRFCMKHIHPIMDALAAYKPAARHFIIAESYKKRKTWKFTFCSTFDSIQFVYGPTRMQNATTAVARNRVGIQDRCRGRTCLKVCLWLWVSAIQMSTGYPKAQNSHWFEKMRKRLFCGRYLMQKNTLHSVFTSVFRRRRF